MDILSDYRELYYKEIELSDRLNGKVSNNILLLSFVGTGIIFLCQELFPLSCNNSGIMFALFLSLTAISFIVAIILFCIAYIGYEYYYFPVEKMYKLVNDNLAYAESSANDITAIVDENIKKRFEDVFIVSAVHNRKQNIKKMRNQRRFTYCFLVSFFLLIIAFLIWIVSINPYS